MTKIWIDDADPSMRPSPEQFLDLVTLKAEVDDVEITLPDIGSPTISDDYVITWKDVPVCQPGQVGKRINYSVEEGEIKSEDGKYVLYINGVVEKVNDDNYTFKVENTRKITSITVKKAVSGNMADRTKGFEFTATLTVADNKPVKLCTVAEGLVTNDKGQVTFTLAHGEEQELSLPVGVKLEIVEDKGAYTATITGDVTGGTANNNTATYTVESLPEAGGTINYLNELTATVDTGIDLDFLPYVTILGVAGLALALMMLKRRRRYDR